MGRLSLLLAMWVAGCGAVANGNGASGDAGPDATSPGPGSTDAGSSDASPRVGDASLPEPPRCDGGAITAPGGGACDSSRLLVAGGGGGCFGAGQFCDTLGLLITEADLPKVPAGFACDAPNQGYVRCTWPLPPSRTVDSAALDGACAATVALPNVHVDCIIYD